jgi:hypothetical protein
MIDTVI